MRKKRLQRRTDSYWRAQQRRRTLAYRSRCLLKCMGAMNRDTHWRRWRWLHRWSATSLTWKRSPPRNRTTAPIARWRAMIGKRWTRSGSPPHSRRRTPTGLCIRAWTASYWKTLRVCWGIANLQASVLTRLSPSSRWIPPWGPVHAHLSSNRPLTNCRIRCLSSA